jgi:PAS domain S-box-containing protein
MPPEAQPGLDSPDPAAMLQSLCRIGEALASSQDLQAILDLIVDQVQVLLRADVAHLRLLDRAGEALELEVGRGLSTQHPDAIPLDPGANLVSDVLFHARSVRGDDLRTDPRARYRDLAVEEGLQAFVGVPVMLRQQPIGAMFLFRRRAEPFTLSEETLLTALVHYLSAAIERHWLFSAMVREQREREAVVEGSASGILVVDARGNVLTMNSAMERLTGWERRDVMGQSCRELIGCRKETRAANGTSWTCPLRPHPTGEEAFFAEHHLCTRDGLVLPVEISYGLIRDEEGHLERIVMVFRDISEHRAIERLRSEMIANVSHELRTPLALVKGYVSILLDLGSEMERAEWASTLRKIHAATNHLDWLVDDLLSGARLEAGELPLYPRVFDLAEKVHEAVDRLAFQASASSLRADVPPEGLLVWADPERVGQILTNLLANAIKYSPPGGMVTVRVRALGDPPRAVVHVIDQGPGIDAKHHPHIFDRFYQADADQQGVGLGLYICQGLVEAMGGQIWLVSEVGQGSTFSFTLPMEADPSQTVAMSTV